MNINDLIKFESFFEKMNEKVAYIGNPPLEVILDHMILDRIINDFNNVDVLVTDNSTVEVIELMRSRITDMKLPIEVTEHIEFIDKGMKIFDRHLWILSSQDEYQSMRGFGVRNVVMHNFDKYEDDVVKHFMNAVYPVIVSGRLNKVVMTGEEKFTDCEVVDV